MLEDTYHYTLSTIPQVLAALIAVIAAFALFRVGAVQRQIQQQGELVLAKLPAMSPDARAAAGHMFGGAKRAAILAHLDAAGAAEAAPRERTQLDHALAYRRKVIGALTQALWMTTLTIVASVILLAVTQPLLHRPEWAYAGMAAGVALMTLSIGANTRLAYLLLRT